MQTKAEKTSRGFSPRRDEQLPPYLFSKTLKTNPILRTEEEKRLVLAAKRGDLAARTRLIEANLPRVISIAAQNNAGLGIEEAIQEGNLGLVRAVQKIPKFIPRRFEFSTYIHNKIRWAISRAGDNYRRGLPVYVEGILRHLETVSRQLTQDLGYEPSPNEIAPELQKALDAREGKKRFKVTAAKITHWQILSQGPKTLEEKEDDPTSESAWSRNAYSAVERSIDMAPIQTKVFNIVNDGVLTDNERMAIGLVFYEGLNHYEAGILLGETQQAVKGLVNSANKKLRQHPQIQKAHGLLEELNNA